MDQVTKIQNYIITVVLILMSAAGGYYFGVRGYELKIDQSIKSVKIENKTPKVPNNIDFSKFWIVWDSVSQQHITKPINPQKLLDGAIAGMVASIGDPYTLYLNAERNKSAKSDLNGEYEGIGAQLGFDEKNILIIVSPLDGSPAFNAGIKAGDKILKIDGKETQGISIDEAIGKIRGTAGTVVTLTLFRTGTKEPFDLNITRDTITVESVKWEDKGDGVVYVRLSRFGENTNAEWENAMTQIKYQVPNLKSLVLDVRNNPGGFLDSALFISSTFIKSGVIVSEKTSAGEFHELKADGKGIFADDKIKLFVLINRGSASASEIVAAALKEKKDAVIIGERSFGKGSVQKSEEYKDGSALHVTIAKWLTPNNNWIDRANSKYADSVYNETDERGNQTIGGVKPDIFVNITEEDVKNTKDPQLDKAIEEAKK
jgi:carboxyl-terminal processing protease